MQDEDEPALDGRRSHRRKRWLVPLIAAVVVVLAVAAIAAIGWRSHRGTASAGAPAALRWWANFPVDASPRPLVLTGDDTVDPKGFATENPNMVHSGRFQLRATLPAGPGTVNGQPVRSAADALAELRSVGVTVPIGSAPLTITAVRLDTATFWTDRGSRKQLAWSFRFAGAAEPAYVLAVPPADRWPRPGMPTRDLGTAIGATVSADGTRATLTFIGAAAGTGPCEAEYAADVVQSRTAVSISERALPNSNDKPGVACNLAGYFRTVTATLRPPLGNRVLVNSYGAALGPPSLPPWVKPQ
jgi:hypothetical protein